MAAPRQPARFGKAIRNRATWIFNVLYPRGPASKLVAEFTIGNRLGQIVVPDLFEHQVQLYALELHGPGFEVVSVPQAQFLVFSRLRQVAVNRV